jgi:hypothetical protein
MVPTHLPQYQQFEQAPFPWRHLFVFYRFLAGNPDPKQQEGFYYRFIYSPIQQEFCLQLVLYYRKQLIPYHVNDYHPIYAYFNDSHELIRVLYDTNHHCGTFAALSLPQPFTVRFPWHGYKASRSIVALPLKTRFFDLNGELLDRWWLQPGKPQFKLRSKFVDPWHKKLQPQASTQISFRDEAVCPYCGVRQLLDTMELDGTLFHISLECQNSHTFVAKYDATTMKMEFLKK